MIGYQMVGTNDVHKAVEFYNQLMPVLGAKPAMKFGEHGQGYAFATGQLFAVNTPGNKEPATIGNGQMTAFKVDSPEIVAAAHAKALELGGTCEGEPGPRGEFGDFSYFRDLDGNKLAVFYMKG